MRLQKAFHSIVSKWKQGLSQHVLDETNIKRAKFARYNSQNDSVVDRQQQLALQFCLELWKHVPFIFRCTVDNAVHLMRCFLDRLKPKDANNISCSVLSWRLSSRVCIGIIEICTQILPVDHSQQQGEAELFHHFHHLG